MFASITLLIPRQLHTVCTPFFILQSLKSSISVAPLALAAQGAARLLASRTEVKFHQFSFF